MKIRRTKKVHRSAASTPCRKDLTGST